MRTIKVNANITIQYNEDKYNTKDIKRFADYGKQGLKSFDYDFAFFERDLLFKLKRIEKDLIGCKFTKHSRVCLKSLRRCIELLEDLDKEGVEFKYVLDGDLFDDLGYQIGKEAFDYKNKMLYTLIDKYKFHWWF